MASVGVPTKVVPPRPKITDWGWPDKTRGWYDFQGLGVRNDYGRFMGDAPNIFFSVALAGAASEITPKEEAHKYNPDAPRTSIADANFVEPELDRLQRAYCKPRNRKITDWGYPNRPRGWYDFQGQGVRNDYGRFVGDHPNIYFSVALAGSDKEYTPKEDEKLYNPAAPSDPFGTRPRAVLAFDKGYPDKAFGWYDVQGQGVKNDFCRFVGDNPVYFSAKLAGAVNEFTPKELKIDEKLPSEPGAPANKINTKPKNAHITDFGWPDKPRGWYDFQGQGVKNDFGRFVGDAPNIYFSVALAGHPNELTPKEHEAKYDHKAPSNPYVVPTKESNFVDPELDKIQAAAGVKPRNRNITDWGYPNRPRGWYDFQKQGVRNDYGRFVGDHPNIYFSVALAGSNVELTRATDAKLYDANAAHDPFGTKPRPLVVADKGWPNRTRGWYDVQGQGVCNDYCRWVGDYPNVWFSAKLAGSAQEFTPKERVIDEHHPNRAEFKPTHIK